MLILIRHGKTQANVEKRYVGSTDVDLCKEGMEEIAARDYNSFFDVANLSKLYSSPLKRCIQTAGIIFPSRKPEILEGFREISFGKFEGLTYEEILKVPGYEDFGNSIEGMTFPEGEDFTEFKDRCISAYRAIENEKNIAIVTHGGVIMAVLSQLFPERDYYSYWVANGEGYKIVKGDEGYSYEKISFSTQN